MATKPKTTATIAKPKPRNNPALAFAEKGNAESLDTGNKSGQVPEGDKRLTANIRADLHTKLKMAAVTEDTTIGEIIERLIEQEYGG